MYAVIDAGHDQQLRRSLIDLFESICIVQSQNILISGGAGSRHLEETQKVLSQLDEISC